ncbi:MAG: aminotransferase class V-fold PLP-dependent enzyme [Micrococcales bacterium]|nr:aminotransferase class V-fold PLP-dependent enzyme [Micrococcales bacterium]
MSRFALDCAVSRPVSDRTARWLDAAIRRAWAVPTAGYHEGKTASALLEQSATTVAQLAGARSAWFTPDPASAVVSAIDDLPPGAACVATTAADSLILQDASSAAARSHGLSHHTVDVDTEGRVQARGLDTLPSPCVLVTAVGNQEIGVLQADLGPWVQRTGSSVVLDASTAWGWVPLPASWDRLILDARTWSGVGGAVAVCSRAARRAPHPFDNVPSAVVAGLTAEHWMRAAPDAVDRVRECTARIAAGVRDGITGLEVRGGSDGHLPHILSISILYVDAEAVQTRLDALGYAVGSGSACASRAGQPSHVLAAVGGFTSGNVRLGLTPQIDDAVAAGFVDALVAVVTEVRAQMGTLDL